MESGRQVRLLPAVFGLLLLRRNPGNADHAHQHARSPDTNDQGATAAAVGHRRELLAVLLGQERGQLLHDRAEPTGVGGKFRAMEQGNQERLLESVRRVLCLHRGFVERTSSCRRRRAAGKYGGNGGKS